MARVQALEEQPKFEVEDAWNLLKDLKGRFSNSLISVCNKNGLKFDSALQELWAASIKRYTTYSEWEQAEGSKALGGYDLEAALEGLKLGAAEEGVKEEASGAEVKARKNTKEKGVLYFTGPQCKPAVLSSIKEARKSIHVIMYLFNDEDIAGALVASAEAGKDVSVIMSEENFKEKAPGYKNAKFFLENTCGGRLRVYRAGTPPGHEYASMHIKALVVDERTVLQGSYNYTYMAARYNEELLARSQDPCKTVLGIFEALRADAGTKRMRRKGVK
ncbi:hypothetical protein KFL_003950110 [Klebsormidium nitens]|uniref:Mitochondrial cardiolipin hydrolase n=1 Tax=Klebsormidium nitens TaxID=105231 RepID=A0A1Y1IAP0_KLENI|nr:hypothetical protein KFL_003950110 [Klebsormidium nitens]|eukprot:GAQ88034.1 hypothetical protein KFL_003950110 [Klebsormidium nitens]